MPPHVIRIADSNQSPKLLLRNSHGLDRGGVLLLELLANLEPILFFKPEMLFVFIG